MSANWDCIIVGGGAAGLSAGLVLGRARRRVLLVDAGEQSNRAAHAVQGVLGHDGRTADDLYRLGREEIARYPTAVVRDGTVAHGSRSEDGTFQLELATGEVEAAATVILATGMEYRPTSLPGVAERWGTCVFHCPFCHGWEVAGRPLAVLGSGVPEMDLHRALMLRAWSDDVTLLAAGLDAAAQERLRAAGVRVEERPVAELRGEGDALDAVLLEDGSELACGGVLIPAPLFRRSDLAIQLGAQIGDPTPITTEAVATDPMCRTGVPGLFAAGDATGRMPSVANAVASGATAAAAVVGTLTGAL